MEWKYNRDSLSKCIMYFADGVARTFYSLDWTSPLSKYRDRDLGLKRLRALIALYGQKAVTAIIYDNTTRQKIEQYYKGTKIN
jgi:hypothetical protein